jgi:hypothetical protein
MTAANRRHRVGGDAWRTSPGRQTSYPPLVESEAMPPEGAEIGGQHAGPRDGVLEIRLPKRAGSGRARARDN